MFDPTRYGAIDDTYRDGVLVDRVDLRGHPSRVQADEACADWRELLADDGGIVAADGAIVTPDGSRHHVYAYGPTS